MTEKMTLKVKGMSCAHCERRVNNALSALSGVVSAKADAKADAVEIEFDPTQANAAKFAVAIEDAGYEVV